MPLNKEATLRYHIIDSCIKNSYHPFPTMEVLIEKCESELGKKFTVSTIQKDIKAMKEDEVLGYLAPIKFSRSRNGYYYEDPEYSIKKVPLHSEEIEALEFAAGIIEQYKGTKFSGTFSMAVGKVLASLKSKKYSEKGEKRQIIFPEKPLYFKGSELIDFIAHCIIEKLTVSFEHYSYTDECFKNCIVHPYMLKEHKNKWYLIGYSEIHQSVRIFGLDRIENIKLSENTYYEIENLDIESFYKHSIGIFFSDPKDILDIELEFSKNIAVYLKAQPIHESQEIVKYADNGGIIIKLKLVPCRELKQLILSYGADVKVVSPKSLKKEIQDELSKAINQY